MNGTVKTEQSILRRLLINPFRIGPTAGTLGKFYHQLASMLGAGLTIVRALDTLEEQSVSGSIRRRMPLMKQHIMDGGNLADAFAMFPDVFDPIQVAMIRAAEQAGRLDEVLETLAESCARRSSLVKVVITAVLYPVLLLHFAFLALPLIKRLGGADAPYWKLALPRFAIFYGFLFVVLVLPRILKQFSPIAYVLDVLRDLVPVLSGVAEKLAISRVARALGGLYGSGTTLGEAMPMTADACGNEIVRRKLHRMRPLIDGGMPLNKAMRSVGGFPAAFVNMIATGEESGQLSGMLANTADYYENEAEPALKRMAVVLPIIIYIAVAAYIGYEIIKFYSALFQQRYGGLETLVR